MSETMHAITVREHGGPDVMEYGEIEAPRPKAGQVLVRTAAVGVNFIDTYLRSGVYASQPPYIPGAEGAGEIIAVGEDVDESRVGSRVAWCSGSACYAEQVVVAANRCVDIPGGVDDAIAANVLLQGITAHYLLDGTAHPHAGDTILLHAGAGGVGLILTQMAAARGIRVITTVSTDKKAELSRHAGAAEVLRYGDDVGQRVRDLTDGEGVAVAYDGVGKDTFEQSLAATRIRGTVALFGGASGAVPPFDLNRLNSMGSLFVSRPTMAHYTADDDEFEWRSSDVMAAVAAGDLSVRVEHRYPLADAAQAHRDVEGRKTTGSLALIP